VQCLFLHRLFEGKPSLASYIVCTWSKAKPTETSNFKNIESSQHAGFQKKCLKRSNMDDNDLLRNAAMQSFEF